MARADSRLHVSIKNDGIASSQARAQGFGSLTRDHEGETRRLARIQMSPANDRFVEPRPCSCLIRHVADDPRGTMFGNRQRLHTREHTVRQNDLPTHVVARVIGLAGAVAHVDQFGFHIRAVTVIGEPNGIGHPISQQKMLRADLPKASLVHVPLKIRTHQAIRLGAIDGELLAVSVRQTILACALQNKICRLVVLRSRRHTMERRQVTEIFVGRSTVGLVAQCGPLACIQKRLLRKSTADRKKGSEDSDEAEQAEAAHKIKIMRIAFTVGDGPLRLTLPTKLHYIRGRAPNPRKRNQPTKFSD